MFLWSVVLCRGHAVGGSGGQGVQDGLLARGRSCLSGALGVQAPGEQVQGLHGGLLVGEVSPGPDRPMVAGIEGLDGVGQADDLADLNVVVQEGDELPPGVVPQPRDRRVGLAPVSR